MRILFYTPFVFRSRDTESLMIKFKELGHEVYYVSQNYGEEIQSLLQAKGIQVFNSPLSKRRGILNFLSEVFYLVTFCRRHRIQIVFSHLEPANFISVFAQFFIKAKVYICRHHVNEFHLIGKDRLISYKLTYKLGKRFIVVSKKAKEFMVTQEKIDPKKIDVINLSYDFNLYDKVNNEQVQQIRKTYDCDLLLITACRMVNDKRPDLSIELLKRLIDQGVSAKLLLLGTGELEDSLKQMIATYGLGNRCFLLGRVNQVPTYLSAADVLVHPSLLDSSSVIVKEAGLVSKPVIVCSQVGDVDDYITNGVNGFVVDQDAFVEQAFQALTPLSSFQATKQKIGEALHRSILTHFSIEHNIHRYDNYLN